MDKADKKNHYRDDLHPMQNMHFRFVRSIRMIGYSKEIIVGVMNVVRLRGLINTVATIAKITC